MKSKIETMKFRKPGIGEAVIWDCPATRLRETQQGLEVTHHDGRPTDLIPLEDIIGRVIGRQMYFYAHTWGGNMAVNYVIYKQDGRWVRENKLPDGTLERHFYSAKRRAANSVLHVHPGEKPFAMVMEMEGNNGDNLPAQDQHLNVSQGNTHI